MSRNGKTLKFRAAKLKGFTVITGLTLLTIFSLGLITLLYLMYFVVTCLKEWIQSM